MASPKSDNPVGRPTEYKPEYCDKVQVAMFEGFSLGAFAGMVDVSRQTITEWMKQYPEFLASVSRAQAKRQLAWEMKAIANAETGKGSTGMIALALKNAGDADWFDKQVVANTHANPDGSAMDTRTIVVLPSNGREKD